jgi:hypothetical protein
MKIKKLPLKLNYLTFLYLFVIALNFYVRSLVPLNAAFLSVHDDQLGVELSSSILSGEWLGEWNNRTLVKPPGYSIYLSLAHYIPIPFALLNQLFYVLIVMILIKKLKQTVPMNFRFKEQFFLMSFVFLIFQPILFASESNRIYRSSMALVVLTLLYSVTLVSLLDKLLNIQNFSNNLLKKMRAVYLDFFGLSLIYAVMSLFRYESFWIVICSAPPIILALVLRWHKLNHGEKKRLLSFLIPIPLVLLVTYSTPVLIIQELNRSEYGVPLTENMFQGEFTEAIKLWSSVDVGRDPRPYIVVSTQQRNAVYEVSHNARLMKPFLESPANNWNVPACSILKLCDNSGSWFTWQVRDAAVATGLVYSERTFQSFFKEIARDIQNACDTSIFDCTRKPEFVGMKPLIEVPLSRLKNFTLSNLKVVVPLKLNSFQFPTKTDAFGAPDEVVKMYHEVVRYDSVSSYDEEQIESTSKILGNIDKFYLILNVLFLLLGVIGIIFGFFRNFNLYLNLVALFLFAGIFSQLIGTSLAQISFGTTPGSQLYVLMVYPMLHMFCLVGLICLLSQFSKKE